MPSFLRQLLAFLLLGSTLLAVLTTRTIAQTSGNSYSLAKLVRGSSSRVLRMVILAVIGFFLMPFTLHKLGPQQYGIWAIAIAFVGYYSFLDLGLSEAVFTHMAYALGRQEHEEARNIYGSSLRVFAAVGLILFFATVVLATGAHYFNQAHGNLLAAVLLIVGLNTAVSFFMRVPFGVLNAGHHFDITAWVLILSAIIRAGLTVMVLDAGHKVVGLAWVNVFASIPANIIVLWSTHHYFPFLKIFSWPRWNRQTARKLFDFGGPVLLGQIADKVRFQTDTLTVSFFIGLTAVAHYSIGTTLIMYYIDAIAAIIGVLIPVLSMQQSVQDFEGFRRSFFIGTRVAFVCSAFIAFGMVAWSRAFVVRWMGSSFTDIYPVIVILALAVFIETSQATSVNALYASLHQKAYAAINVSEALLNLLLSLMLARPFGMIGVALGTLIPSVIFRCVLQPIIVQKCLQISVRDTLAVYSRTGVRCAAFLLVPLVITWLFLAPNYPHLILVASLSVTAYALPAWWFEFHGIGSERLLRPLRAVHRLMFVR